MIPVPPLASYGQFALQADGKEMSTTMAAVRLFGNLLRDKTLGPRIVPIVADEARTFGMSNMFRQVGIYSPVGQLYEPEDAGSMLYYKEARDGQLLEEGITEAGAMASWTAAATAYSVSGTPMLPFYIYYSMFGFQRVGDLIWAAADQRARGFLLGATAGRTTLGGEGLQHQDGSSHVVAATVPNCRAYDPAFAYELAVIMDRGMRAMMEGQADEFYYVTVMNENYAQPSLPAGAEEGIIRGLYRLRAAPEGAREPIRLVGSGAILREVIAAADLLETDWDVAAEVFSATSFSELDREARAVERWNRLHPEAEPRTSHLAACLPGRAPVDRRDRLRARLPAANRPLRGGPLRSAWDGRVRAQRHARQAAQLLRGRPPADRARRARRARRRGAARPQDHGGRDQALRHRPGASRLLDLLIRRLSQGCSPTQGLPR